jgi:hypothetical protein
VQSKLVKVTALVGAGPAVKGGHWPIIPPARERPSRFEQTDAVASRRLPTAKLGEQPIFRQKSPLPAARWAITRRAMVTGVRKEQVLGIEADEIQKVRGGPIAPATRRVQARSETIPGD